MAANQRQAGEIGINPDIHHQQSLGFGINYGYSAPAAVPNFFDHEGSAYIGELEAAFLMQAGGVFGTTRAAESAAEEDTKPAFLLTCGGTGTGTGTTTSSSRPPTLEMFPSWPIRQHQHQHQHLHLQSAPHVTGGAHSHSADSTDSCSAYNTATTTTATTVSPQLDFSSDSPASAAAAAAAASSDQKQPMATTGDPRTASGAEAGRKPHDRRRGAAGPNPDRPLDAKTLRRLAQNREAARKSRLRKKAYVQQLESSRVKLAQLEQDLHRARSQGLVLGGGPGAGGSISAGAAMFDMDYARWLDDDAQRMADLRGGLQAQLPDDDLRAAVDGCLAHYDHMFQIKGAAAREDVFYLLTGMWASPAERCFMWLGGFRPSEILRILIPHLDPLTDQQLVSIYSLQQSSQQAEDALAQGYDQLQQSLADTVATSGNNDSGNYMGQMHIAAALGKLANLEGFVRQADNLRQQTLHQLCRILTIRQAARCFLTIGEYHNRLRCVSSLWASRPRENMMEENLCATTSNLEMVPQPLHNQFSAF